jgi:hypothetical protein
VTSVNAAAIAGSAQSSSLGVIGQCGLTVLVDGVSIVRNASGQLTVGQVITAAQVCTAIGGLVAGGQAVVGTTVLVGADCKTYTLPTAVAGCGAQRFVTSNPVSYAVPAGIH